jgi:hypothetical protein
MTVTATVLIESKAASTSNNTEYTSTNLRTIIDKFTAVNTSTTVAASISVSLVPYSSTVADNNTIVKTKTLQPLETYTFPELVGHVLGNGDFISVIATTATVTIRSSGRIVT